MQTHATLVRSILYKYSFVRLSILVSSCDLEVIVLQLRGNDSGLDNGAAVQDQLTVHGSGFIQPLEHLHGFLIHNLEPGIAHFLQGYADLLRLRGDDLRIVGTLAEQQAEERAREQAQRQEIRRSVPEESAPCESIEIPFFELPVSAGLGVDLLAQDGAQETISVPATPTTRRADFSVLVEGDSMEPMFSDGDIVLVEQEQEVPEGQVGIFAVNGAGYIKKAGRRKLISANKDYDDILISPDDSVRCFGLVIGKL